MSKLFVEINYPRADDSGDYDSFEVTAPSNSRGEWDFSSNTDKSQYDSILADGVDKTELDTFIQTQVDETDEDDGSDPTD